MSPSARRGLSWTALIVLLVLHNDFWLWNDARIVLGLPVGLLYHVAYCAAASVAMALLVVQAWPAHLEVTPTEDDRR